jgi:hypothetical protein
MVSSSLDFLGIGASKLTEEREAFEQAINRCDRPGRRTSGISRSWTLMGIELVPDVQDDCRTFFRQTRNW